MRGDCTKHHSHSTPAGAESDLNPTARHAAISFEVVEWSERLKSVTSVWLGAGRRCIGQLQQPTKTTDFSLGETEHAQAT